MSEYFKASLRMDHALDANYNSLVMSAAPPQVPAYEIAATEVIRRREYIGTAAETLIAASKYTSAQLKFFALKNLDTTNFVTVNYKSVAGAAALIATKVAPGGIFCTTDIDNTTATATAVTVTADTAACLCEIVIVIV